MAEIAQMCRQENWRLAVWDVERGLQIPNQFNGQTADAGGNDRDPGKEYKAEDALADQRARERYIAVGGTAKGAVEKAVESAQRSARLRLRLEQKGAQGRA